MKYPFGLEAQYQAACERNDIPSAKMRTRTRGRCIDYRKILVYTDLADAGWHVSDIAAVCWKDRSTIIKVLDGKYRAAGRVKRCA